jgi:hypothetical protein
MVESSKWKVVVAQEDEVRPAQVQRLWPCTDPKNSNRYLGCIGVRRCRALGTQTCIFGRWPTSARLDWFPRD